MFQILGYCLVFILLGYLGYNAAQKGDGKAKIFMIAMIVIAVLSTLGSFANKEFGLAQILAIVITVVFTVLIKKAQQG